jgi:flavin reductase (DIM6/NTAB) family NADH-FMN oxidoreductase RutF
MMDADAKKTALRMIPYVLTADGSDGIAAATVNWVTQASFAPPLVAVGVKVDSGIHAAIQSSKAFGDHSIAVGEVVGAGLALAPTGRADDATLWLKDLGEKMFYGG